MIVVGLILIGLAAVMAPADSGELSRRMPTQVPPRALASVPLVIGVALVAAGLLN
jgi:hypothetical protein